MHSNSNIWDRYATLGYDALCALIPYEQLQHDLLKAAALVPDARLLVAGCGTGNTESLLCTGTPHVQVDAVDFSLIMLERARAKCQGATHIRHIQADLCQPLPLPTAGYDVAVMCNVLYALRDAPAALAEIARVVRPGGRFVLCDRYPRSNASQVGKEHFAALRALPFRTRMARLLRTALALPFLIRVMRVNREIDHLHHTGIYHLYTVDEIMNLLAQVGFTCKQVQTVYAGQCWLVCAEREGAP